MREDDCFTGTDEQQDFQIHMALYGPHQIITAPVSDELENLDEELAEAFPPHFALQLHLVAAHGENKFWFNSL